MHVRRTATLALSALLAVACLLGPAAAAGAASPPSSVMLSEPTFAGPFAAGARAAPGVPQPGDGGWYWPVGTEDFQGWSGWLEPRGSYLHVAQDMPCAYRHAVYAIGDGVVFISRADAGGFGVGGAPGGCIIIAHTTAAGTKFHALYGHVCALMVKAGQHVVAGQAIAQVNGCRHLHFSVHRGFTYRDGNPYAGHVPRSWVGHGGYVDPVKFLKTNPRAAAYQPPALPRVEIVTQAPPLQYGAAAGFAYWTEEGSAGSLLWRDDLSTGARATLAPGDVVPAFDTRRYTAEALAAPALGFTVSDHLPVLALTAKHDTPPWGKDASLVAGLTNSTGAPLQGGILKLQRLSGGRWKNVRLDVTGADGEATFLYAPSAATVLRVTFAPPTGQPEARTYLAARSTNQTVTPHAALTTPREPAVIDAADLVTAAGDLLPRHPAGGHSVKLVFQRRGDGGDWVTQLTVAAVNRDAPGSDATRFVGHARLTPGSWRVQAVHPADDAHALSASSWRSFAVE